MITPMITCPPARDLDILMKSVRLAKRDNITPLMDKARIWMRYDLAHFLLKKFLDSEVQVGFSVAAVEALAFWDSIDEL